ncbi:MAG: ABC transporter permease [Deltaproteobacteria bacterium]|nr:ABC transporter permease [Deltaproteobacteria bacterium]
MAWRNIWRHPRRAILTMAAIAFATVLLVFMLSWQFGSYDTMINAAVKVHTGHLQVQAAGYHEQQNMHLVVPDPVSVSRLLDDIPDVAAHTARATAFSLVSSHERTYGVAVRGIDPTKEAQVTTVGQVIRQGKYLSDDDAAQALVGGLLAKNLRVGVGDELVLLGQGRDGSIAATVVQVAGIFSYGQDELDRNVIYIPLPYFQEVYSMQGAVHEVVVLGTSLEAVPRIKRSVSAELKTIDKKNKLVVLDWMELMPGLIQSIQMDLISGFIMYLILIIVVAFSILNTFLMVIFERTREFGVFMALGTTPGRLTRLLLLESTTLTLLGTAMGIVAGSLVTWYFQVHGIVISGTSEMLQQYGLPERMYPQLSTLSIAVGAGLVLAITLAAALYPALKVRRLRPVEAMRAV